MALQERDFLFWPIVAIAGAVQPLFLYKVVQLVRRAGIVETCKHCLRGCDEQAEDAPEAQEMMAGVLAARRVHCARTIVNMLWAAFCFRLLFIFVELLIAGQRSNAAGGLFRSLQALLSTVMLTAGVFFPESLITSSTLPFWMWGWALSMCTLPAATALVHTPLEILLVNQPFAWLISITLGGLYLRFRALLVASTLVSTSFVFAASLAASNNTKITFRDVALAELLAWLWRLVVFYWSERVLCYSVRKEVEAVLGKCQESAVSSLLDLMCDAVVDLDHDFKLKDHFPKLAGMLMHGVGKSLRSLPFSDFIAHGEDRRRFDDTILQSRDEQEPSPQMMSLCMRDSVGNRVAAVLYHVPYLSITGRRHHLVGLQESPDGGHAPDGITALGSFGTARRQRTMPAAVLRPSVAQAVRGRRGSVGNVNIGGGSRDEIGSLGAVGSRVAAGRKDRIAVVATEGLPLHMADAAFFTRYGVADGHRSLDKIVRDRGKGFERRVLSVAQRVRSGDLPPHTGRFSPMMLTSSEAQVEILVNFRRPPAGDGAPHILRLRITALEPDPGVESVGPGGSPASFCDNDSVGATSGASEKGDDIESGGPERALTAPPGAAYNMSLRL